MLKIAKIVGLNSDQEAALALVCPSGESLTLFVILACQADDAFSRTKQALVEVEDLFFLSEKTSSERLEEVFEQMKKSLADTENLQVLLALADLKEDGGQVFYLLCQGEQLAAYLVREGHSSDLAQTSSGKLISGFVHPGDRVVMTTKSLENILGSDFKKLFSLPLANLEEEVSALLPQAQISPLATIVLEEEKMVEGDIPVADFVPSRASHLPCLQIAGILPKILPRSRKALIIIGVFLLLVGVGVSFLFYKNRQDTEFQATLNNYFQKARGEYQKAQDLKDSDSLTSQNSLKEASLALEQVLKLQKDHRQALELKKEIEGGAPNILKVFPVNDFPLWLDLGLIKKGFSGEKMSLSLNKVLVLDPNLKVLVKVELTSKAPQVLAGEEKLGEGKLSSLNGEVAWVFSADKGLIKIEEQAKVVIKKDEEWGEIGDLYGFAGNAYLLDKTGGQIWKYLPIESGYSDKKAYFKEEVKMDLSEVIKMQIDSSIWVLKRNGEILKFTQGSPDYFALSGLDQGVKDPKSFFVSDKTENLYLLDSGNNRLVILDKKGNYLSQYQGDKFRDFTDIVVDEGNQKVYLLEGSKVYLLDLK